jgi:hypothetical protein
MGCLQLNLELHADTMASRQGINFTGYGEISDSLTGVVFEQRNLVCAGPAGNEVIQQLS